MNKKILTIENLIDFCEQQKFDKFNSKESGYRLCVQVPASFESDDSEDSAFLIGNIKLLHCGANRNHSSVTEEAARKCMSSIAYKPILANFTDVNGELDFTSHDFDFNEDGSITYYEKQVGCFTADKPYMEQDPDHEDRKYIYAKAAIPRQYTAAADIIERKGGTKVSAELNINKLSYDSKEKILLLEDIEVMGCTLLGVDPSTGEDIVEGMESARLDIADFSVDNNSVFNKAELINDITQAVLQQLDNNINNQRKEDKIVGDFDNKEVTIEDTQIVEENTEEETETTATEEDVEVETSETPEVVEEFEEENNGDSENVESTDGNNEESVDETIEERDEATEEFSGKKVYSINGMNFEISLSEIQNSIFELVNNTYSESDNDYYSVEVYESSKTVVMIGWFTGKAYRQGYKVRSGVYSLVGDRCFVKVVYATPEEEAELDKMRSNYSSIADKLSKYEAEPEKIEILNSADYASIANQADFAELKKQENHFDLTVDELKDKADAILLQYAKSGKLNFAATEQKKEEPKKDFFAFARTENTSFLDGLLNKK